jgi:hypothetical protein
MSQTEAVALIYVIANKSLQRKETHGRALRQIVGIIEDNFFEKSHPAKSSK